MDYFSIQTDTAKRVAEQEKVLASELSAISSAVSSVLGNASTNNALKGKWRTNLANAVDDIAACQRKMAVMSAVLYEAAVEYEAAEKNAVSLFDKGEVSNSDAALAVYDWKEKLKIVWETTREVLPKSLLLNLPFDMTEEIVHIVDGGWKDLTEIYNSNKTVDEMITEGFKVFKNTMIEPIKGIKTIKEWVKQEKREWPKELKGTMEFVDKIDEGIKLYNAFKDYTVGLAKNDSATAAEGAGGYIELLSDFITDSITMKNLKSDYGYSPLNPVSLVTDYGTGMVKNWIKAISQDGATTQEVYYQTFMHSALEVGMDCVYNKTAIAMAYYPLDTALGVFGVDLKGMYEEVSDKKGIAAVMDATGELKNIIVENSSWENWKNGMSIMGDYISDGFKDLGEGAKKLWNKIF